MAPDNWHHLEGTYPRDRMFRLYLYDDYARPLPPDQLKRARARVVTKETFDPSSRKTTKDAAFPLRLARNGGYLEARVDRASFPIELTAKVQFAPNAPEHRFDFAFEAITAEPQVVDAESQRQNSSRRDRAASLSEAGSVGNATSATAPTARGAGVELDARTDVAAIDPLKQSIPESTAGIVKLLSTRNQEIADLITRRDFTLVWIPTFQAKELALALAPHLEHLAPLKREIAERALHELVRSAWLLDAYSDVGNRRQIDAAYAAFYSALQDLISGFGEPHDNRATSAPDSRCGVACWHHCPGCRQGNRAQADHLPIHL